MRPSVRPGRTTALALTAVLLAGCGGTPTAASGGGAGGGKDSAALAKYAAMPDGQLVSAAKKEGSVVIYASNSSIQENAAAFEKQYGIKVKTYRADSEEVLQRVLQEAGRRQAARRPRRHQWRRTARHGRQERARRLRRQAGHQPAQTRLRAPGVGGDPVRRVHRLLEHGQDQDTADELPGPHRPPVQGADRTRARRLGLVPRSAQLLHEAGCTGAPSRPTPSSPGSRPTRRW